MSRIPFGLIVGLAVITGLFCQALAPPAAASPQQLVVVGQVTDARGQGLPEVQLRFWAPKSGNLTELAALETDNLGYFQFSVPGSEAQAFPHVTVKASKPGWRQPQEETVRLAAGEPVVLRLILVREPTPATVLALVFIAGVFFLTSTRLLSRTLAALSGAALMLFLSYTLGTWSSRWFILSFGEAVQALDFNVFFALLGIMFFSGALKQTNAIPVLVHLICQRTRRTAAVIGGGAGLAFVLAALITPLNSLWLLLPSLLEAGFDRGLSPAILLLPVAVAAQLGGLGTLTGSPVNLLLASRLHLTWLVFLLHLLPAALLGLLVSWGCFVRRARRSAAVLLPPTINPPTQPLRPERRLSVLLALAGLLTLGLLVAEGFFGLPFGMAILSGAMLLVAVGRLEIVGLLAEEVFWPLLIYLLATFILAAGGQATGLQEQAAALLTNWSQGQPQLLALLVLWSAAFLTLFLEPILLTVVYLPILSHLQHLVNPGAAETCGWALILGVALGSLISFTGYGAPAWALGLSARLGYEVAARENFRQLALLTLLLLLGASFYLLWLGGGRG